MYLHNMHEYIHTHIHTYIDTYIHTVPVARCRRPHTHTYTYVCPDEAAPIGAPAASVPACEGRQRGMHACMHIHTYIDADGQSTTTAWSCKETGAACSPRETRCLVPRFWREPGVVVAEVMRVRLHRAKVDEIERVCLYIVQKIRPAHAKQ